MNFQEDIYFKQVILRTFLLLYSNSTNPTYLSFRELYKPQVIVKVLEKGCLVQKKIIAQISFSNFISQIFFQNITKKVLGEIILFLHILIRLDHKLRKDLTKSWAILIQLRPYLGTVWTRMARQKGDKEESGKLSSVRQPLRICDLYECDF